MVISVCMEATRVLSSFFLSFVVVVVIDMRTIQTAYNAASTDEFVTTTAACMPLCNFMCIMTV